jgi:serine/threonine protein kinase
LFCSNSCATACSHLLYTTKPPKLVLVTPKHLLITFTGAFGSVFKCVFIPNKKEYAVKLLPVPKTVHDHCILFDLFSEVYILDKFKNDVRICQMYDFGVDNDNYWVVMKNYKCSLKQWRSVQTKSLHENLPLYLNVYANVLNTVSFLNENSMKFPKIFTLFRSQPLRLKM